MVVSRLGVIGLTRRLYRCRRCGREHGWLDQALGLSGGLTASAARLALLLVVDLPERRAVDRLKRLCGLSLSASTLFRLRERWGGMAEQAHKKQSEAWLAPVGPEQPAPACSAPPCELIVREADGVNVRFIDGWHDVKVGVSYGLGVQEESGKRKRRIEPQYCAVRADAQTLGRHLQALSLAQGLRGAPASQFLSDGGNWMAGLARGPLSWSQWTLDFYHASQHVADALKVLHGEGSETMHREHRRLRRRLLQGEGNPVVRRSLSRKADRRQLDSKQARAVHNVIAYLELHCEQMHYDHLRKRGWPIGSGMIEGGGCKLYIQQRFKRPGARWTREGFAHLEALRRLAYNDHWDQLSSMFHSRN